MFNFNKKLETLFKIIAENASNNGVFVYFVGGMVRDALMHIQIKDIDILIEGSAISFVENLTQNSKLDIVIKSIHKDFNTVKTVINGVEIDFASTREEEYPKSGCLPVIKNVGCPIEYDLKRRDFTINSIAVRFFIDKNSLKYQIIDPFFGILDIKNKILKVLHNNSYIDDPTRILRGLDFILRFDFNFSGDDEKLIDKYIKSVNREGLSIDRVKLTLKKLFSGKRAKEAYGCILENKFYKIWCDEPEFKSEWAQKLCNAAFIFNLPQEEIFLKAIFKNFTLCNEAILKYSVNISNFEIYNFYKNYKPIDLALQYSIYDDENAVFYFKALKDVKPDITGNDLIKQGFVQGKALGDELSRCLREKLNSISRN